MSKKKKSSAKSAKQGHPARANTAANIVSIDEFRARSTGDEILGAYAKWIRSNSTLHTMGDPVPALMAFLSSYQQASSFADTLSLLPSTASMALGMLQEECSLEDFEFLLHVVLGYSLFLQATGRWGGTDEQFDEIQEMLMEFVDEVADAEFDDRVFVVPAIDRASRVRTLGELPLTRRLLAFIQWFGTKRDVTSNGVLTRKDIEGAAAALDIAAVGVASNPTQPGAIPDGPLRVSSAQDVIRLDLYWSTLVDMGLIELGASKATLENPLAALEGEAHEELLSMLVIDVALNFYSRFCTGDDAPEITLENIDDALSEDISSILMSALLLDAGFDDGYPVEDLDTAIEAVEQIEQEDLMVTKLGLGLLAAEGLVDIGETYSIPPVFKKVIAVLLAEPEDVEVEYEDPADVQLNYLGAA